MLDFKVGCHYFCTTSIQILQYQIYVIIGFFRGGPGGAAFTMSGFGGTGILGAGNGLPSSLSLEDDLDDFLFIPGRPDFTLDVFFLSAGFLLSAGSPVAFRNE
jgi:hypothetical protein